MDLTVRTANTPAAYPIMRMIREHGNREALRVIAHILQDVDKFYGGDGDTNKVIVWARMVMDKFKHRTVEGLAVAIRDGMYRTDKDGKVYGKLSWPTIAVWLDAHEQEVMQQVDEEVSASRFTGHNLGKEYLDELQRDSEQKDRTIRKQSALIDQLRKKLDTKNDK